MDLGEFFKIEEEVVQPEPESKGPTIYDFIYDVMNKKNGIFSEENEHVYIPYSINHMLYPYRDIIYDAQEMNQSHHLDKELQYDYYFYSIPKKFREIIKWGKKEKKDETVKQLMKFYGYNRRLAQDVLRLHSKEDIDNIIQSMNIGGLSAERKKKTS